MGNFFGAIGAWISVALIVLFTALQLVLGAALVPFLLPFALILLIFGGIGIGLVWLRNHARQIAFAIGIYLLFPLAATIGCIISMWLGIAWHWDGLVVLGVLFGTIAIFLVALPIIVIATAWHRIVDSADWLRETVRIIFDATYGAFGRAFGMAFGAASRRMVP